MEEIAKSLSKFLRRDTFYIMGGLLTLGAIMFFVDYNIKLEFSTFQILVLSSFCYIIGFVNQEVLSFFGIVTVTYPLEFGRFAKWLYRRFTRREFTAKGDEFNYLSFMINYGKSLPDILKDNYNRIVSLKQLGSTLGANMFFVSVLITIKEILDHSESNLALTITSWIFCLSLIAINRVKTMQEIQFMSDYKDRNPDDNNM